MLVVDMEALLAGTEAKVQAAFMRLFADLRSDEMRKQLVDLLSRGEWDEAMALADPAIFAFSREVTSIYVAAGTAFAADASVLLGHVFPFSITDPIGVAEMRANELRLVQVFTQHQREVTRNALIDGMQRGLNPRDQARLFQDVVTLTPRQEAAVQNYRRLLEQQSREVFDRALRDRRFDPTVERSIRTGTPLSREQIDRMVSRYRERYIRYRANTIARTESLSAIHRASEETWRQIIANGLAEPETIIGTWTTARDERVRSSHRTMHKQKRPYGTPFITGNGVAIRYPGDPSAPRAETIQCRCLVTRRIEGALA